MPFTPIQIERKKDSFKPIQPKVSESGGRVISEKVLGSSNPFARAYRAAKKAGSSSIKSNKELQEQVKEQSNKGVIPKPLALFQNAILKASKPVAPFGAFIAGGTGSLVGQGAEGVIGKENVEKIKSSVSEKVAPVANVVSKGVQEKPELGTLLGTLGQGLDSTIAGDSFGISKNIAKSVTKPARKAVARKLEESAKNQLFKMLAPTKRDTKAKTKRLIETLISDVPVVKSLDDFLSKTQGRKSVQGKRLDKIKSKGGLSGEVSIDETIKKLIDKQNKTKVRGQVIDDEKVAAVQRVIERMEALRKRGNDVLDGDEQLSLKQLFDKKGQKKGVFDKPRSTELTEKYEKFVSDILRKELNSKNPDLNSVNEKMSYLIDLESVLKETIERQIGQQGTVRSGTGIAAGSIIGSTVGASFGPLATAVAGALGAGVGAKLTGYFASPYWRSVSAKAKKALANAISKGTDEAVQNAFNLIDDEIKVISKSALSSSSKEN